MEYNILQLHCVLFYYGVKIKNNFLFLPANDSLQLHGTLNLTFLWHRGDGLSHGKASPTLGVRAA